MVPSTFATKIDAITKITPLIVKCKPQTVKVDVLRDSHTLLVTPYREFERKFGGKTVLNSFAFNYRSHETKIVLFVFMPNGSWPSSSGLRGRRRTYYTILKLADHALSIG
jgi:hypothetical protein